MSPKVIITFTDGSLKNKTFEYEKSIQCDIGRDSDCTIQIPDDDQIYDTVSRRHCLLSINLPKVSIRDLDSKHGTYVEGTCIGKRNEKSEDREITAKGAIVRIGETTTFKVEIVGTKPIDLAKELRNKVAQAGIKGAKVAGDAGWKNLGSIYEKIMKYLELSEKIPKEEKLSAIRGHEIIKSLGKGRYGEVYLAKNSTGKKVALKIMLPEVEVAVGDKKAERFAREIENIKFLVHPNVVRFIDHSNYDGNFFYSMEYCEVGNLAQLVEYMGGTLPLDLAKSIIFDILEGLDYTHNVEVMAKKLGEGYEKVHGLVHRDLKPENILLTNDRLRLVAKIGDYGLSKSFELAGFSGQTLAEDPAIASYGFVSRLQMLDYQMATPEVDVWAAAACLYYMLTATYPRNFDRDTSPDLVVLGEEAVPILDRNPYIPAKLAAVINLALREDSSQHNAIYFKNAKDFKEALIRAFS
jgi:eukaryotic-like serine/threonine-protein kinase